MKIIQFLFFILIVTMAHMSFAYGYQVSIQKTKENIDSLSRFLDYSDEYLWSQGRAARIELARRGDVKARKRLFADLYSSDLIEQSRALEAMLVLADKEAVYHLGEMLSHQGRGGRIVVGTRPDGSVVLSSFSLDPPADVAADLLTKLLEAVPTKKEGIIYTDEEKRLWREWWQQVRPQFSEFFPNEEK